MVNDNTATRQRLIITFGKFGALKYTSNLDTAKIWERVLRRANLPLLYSEGFNTRPRIQLANALPLGFTSECELLDVSLRTPIELEGVAERLTAVSPQGLRVYDIHEASLHTPALQTLVRSAEYRIHFLDEVDRALLQARVEALLSRDSIIKTTERKARKSASDLRPLLYDLHIDDTGDLVAHLATGERGNFRPDDLLREMQLNDHPVTIHRLRLHTEVSK